MFNGGTPERFNSFSWCATFAAYAGSCPSSCVAVLLCSSMCCSLSKLPLWLSDFVNVPSLKCVLRICSEGKFPLALALHRGYKKAKNIKACGAGTSFDFDVLHSHSCLREVALSSSTLDAPHIHPTQVQQFSALPRESLMFARRASWLIPRLWLVLVGTPER